MMILTTTPPWINTSLNVAGWRYGTDLGNMMKKYATKRQGSIDPSALMKTRNVITVMGFPCLLHIRGLASWNINIVLKKDSVDCFACLSSTLYFNRWSPLCASLFFCSINHPLFQYLCLLCLKFQPCTFICWRFKCMLWQPCQTASICWPFSRL